MAEEYEEKCSGIVPPSGAVVIASIKQQKTEGKTDRCGKGEGVGQPPVTQYMVERDVEIQIAQPVHIGQQRTE